MSAHFYKSLGKLVIQSSWSSWWQFMTFINKGDNGLCGKSNTEHEKNGQALKLVPAGFRALGIWNF